MMPLTDVVGSHPHHIGFLLHNLASEYSTNGSAKSM